MTTLADIAPYVSKVSVNLWTIIGPLGYGVTVAVT